eukprot:9199302-Alexandrium_andersonii.AAC.1
MEQLCKHSIRCDPFSSRTNPVVRNISAKPTHCAHHACTNNATTNRVCEGVPRPRTCCSRRVVHCPPSPPG